MSLTQNEKLANKLEDELQLITLGHAFSSSEIVFSSMPDSVLPVHLPSPF